MRVVLRNATATMLTVDVESDWGTGEIRGIREALPWLLELLDAHRARATFFVVADLCEPFAEHVRADGPHEVGSHGLTHARLTRLSDARVELEIGASKRRLEQQGYEVGGFRAPFLAAPRDLRQRLHRRGYRYDASRGSLFPRWPRVSPNGRPPDDGLPSIGGATLAGGAPANLTWLRLLDPWGARLLRPATAHFSLHLHELLDGDGGWHALPRGLRAVHARSAGRRARELLTAVVARLGPRLVACREGLGEPARR